MPKKVNEETKRQEWFAYKLLQEFLDDPLISKTIPYNVFDECWRVDCYIDNDDAMQPFTIYKSYFIKFEDGVITDLTKEKTVTQKFDK